MGQGFQANFIPFHLEPYSFVTFHFIKFFLDLHQRGWSI